MHMLWTSKDVRIGVIGLGYVGLPLAVSFAKKFDVVGFDINPTRVEELQRGHDRTLEVSDERAGRAPRLRPPPTPRRSRAVNVYIVTTPTPIDEHKQPDLRPGPGGDADRRVDPHQGDVVIYESTVYPGATEEDCVPLLEEISGLRFNEDFFVGYSPERINPGDKEHRFETIVKVTSGSTPEAAEFVDALYNTVVDGRHAPRAVHQGRRGRQGHREHPARRQHRPRQRAGARLRPSGHRHARRARGRGHEVELPARSGPVSSAVTASASTPTTSRTRRRPSATTPRSSWPVVDSTTRWVSTSPLSCIRAMIAQGTSTCGAPRPGAGPDLQGEHPRPPQHPGRRHRRRAQAPTASRSTCTTRGSTRPKRSHEYGFDHGRRPTPTHTTPSCWPWVTTSSRASVLPASARSASATAMCSTTSRASSTRPNQTFASEPTDAKLRILITGGAGFIGSNLARLALDKVTRSR